MTPSELRELLLSGNFDKETYNKIPAEAHGIWFSRPKFDRHVTEGSQYMRFRVFLIAAGTIYLFTSHQCADYISTLALIIASYEFAYYAARKELSEQQDRLALESYIERVDKFIRKK